MSTSVCLCGGGFIAHGQSHNPLPFHDAVKETPVKAIPTSTPQQPALSGRTVPAHISKPARTQHLLSPVKKKRGRSHICTHRHSTRTHTHIYAHIRTPVMLLDSQVLDRSSGRLADKSGLAVDRPVSPH